MSTSGDPGWDVRLVEVLSGDARPGASEFLAGLPPGYREATTPEEAVEDFAACVALAGSSRAWAAVTPAVPADPPATAAPAAPAAPAAFLGTRHRLAVRRPLEEGSSFRLRRLGTGAMELTTVVPIIESFGLVVVQSLPLLVEGKSIGPVHLDDISVRVDGPVQDGVLAFDYSADGPRLVEALEAASTGLVDIDPLNRLVVSAGLAWRQVTVLRAYLRYWHQVNGLTRRQLADPPLRYPALARALIEYFEARFDPAGGQAQPQPSTGSGERLRCSALLDRVDHLDDDRVIRAALALIEATLRTNYFSVPGAGGLSPLVLKLRSRAVPELPVPTPLVETFVHGPTVEAIHIRAGLVARGGIRWSERPDDFRTEVLDLAFAQVKKNAVIVPTGAKGGFVCRVAGHVGGGSGPAPTPAQIEDAYQAFVAGLLDVTDNIVGGHVTTPPGVVAFDGPDPYLVVAADKGTATFSDVANAIAESRGFWLGDAFASGGSHGYDHKAMGVTARGAWISVKRHFRQLGIDVASDPIRVVGVGDMSGDVFGNGMLQSRSIRLVAAFDHRHVFLDPEPDPESSYEERQRLAGLARSSWDDYRRETMSQGGGIYARDAKSVPLSNEARRALGVGDDALSPPRLVSAVLAAPVDLLWFGGIGTFVKATDEADADVADHPDDAVRITADRVRARVVAEGANLGVTQRGRIQYSRRGGRINADFIDNAAGVATSDREVNLKILLALAAERGRISPDERNGYLERAEGEVATEVLRQVDHSVAALNRAAATSAGDLDAYEALIDDLEGRGVLDRTVEVLPDGDELARRRRAAAGLIRPELATLLTYAKSDLVSALEKSALSGSPALLDSAVGYFPAEMRADFADLIPEHRLIRRLVATDVAGELVDNMGIVWAHDLATELGRSLDQVAAAFWVGRQLTGAGALWAELEDPEGLTADAEAALHACVSTAVASITRFYLAPPGDLDPVGLVARDGSLADRAGSEPEAGMPGWEAMGVDEAVARRFASPAWVAEAVRAGAVSRAGRSGDVEAVEVLRALAALPVVAAVATTAGRLDGDRRTPPGGEWARAGEQDRDSGGTAGSGARISGVGPAGQGPVGSASEPRSRLLVWQARAVLDDLDRWRSATAAVILAGRAGETAGPGVDAAGPAEAVARWAESHRDELARAEKIVCGRPAGEGVAESLAAAGLALRRLPPPA